MKTLMIAPEGVYADGDHLTPDHIILVLPDGQSLDIDTAVKYLQRKYKAPRKPGKLSRIKEILTESDSSLSHLDSTSVRVSTDASTQSQTS